MDKKDLIFLAAAQATSRKLHHDTPFKTIKERFEKWHKNFSDIYDELDPKSSEQIVVKASKVPKAKGALTKKTK